MRKYLMIYSSSLLSKLQYLGNIFGRAVVYTTIIFLFTRLWKYMYLGGSTVGGYSYSQLIWYVILGELMWFSARPNFIRVDIANDIKSGKIVYTLNKPYNYLLYVLAKFQGEIIINFGINIIIALAIGIVMVGFIPDFQLIALPFGAVTICLSTFIMAFVYLIFALSSFWFEENAPFIWIYEKFVLLFGIMFPVEFFPVWLQPIIKISPIYSTIYAPAKLLVDFSINRWLELSLIQLAYLCGTSAIVMLIFSKGVRKLNVNGG